MADTTAEPLHPKVVLAVAAHPDDLEYGIAGSIATWVKEGAEAYYLILTNGNKGSEDRSLSCNQLRDIRRAEQEAAGKVLGLKQVFFADYDDGLLTVSPEVKRDIVRVIRRVKPDVVLTMDPTMVYSEAGFINHTDHRAAGQSTIDAVFPLARDHLSFPELLKDEGLEPHKVKTLLLTNFDKQNFYVDISKSLDAKLKALAEHKSQIPDWNAAETRVHNWAELVGGKAGVTYAEGFVRIDPPA
ncbi:MAG TPA: PIG-L deacetylase family protein [Candidatus Binatia bacterium]|nr:PIG-L deacetylase family protein [Candidatus Binatia bacterium]